MAWWAGRGAAEILAHEGEALLMARATGRGDLATLAHTDDGAAAAILCDCASELHALSGDPPPGLVPLSRWFAALGPAASAHGGVLAQARTVAERLLATPDPPVVLHGDIHHGNVLDFGSDGWRVIDPKGLWGDRAFDYANLFCNPGPSIALAPGRLEHLAPQVAAHAGLAPRRLLSWVLAYAGLSAAWTLAGGGEPTTALGVARRAAAALELPAS